MTSPPSIGDQVEAPKLKLVQEAIPLPGTRQAVINLFSSILGQGMVQKVVVQIGKPVRVERYVPEEMVVEEAPLEDLQDNSDLFSQVRNAEMHESGLLANLPPYEYLFRVFNLLTQRNLRPKALLVRDMATVCEWLKLERAFFPINEIFGTEIREVRDLPKDTAILVGVAPQETSIDAVSFSVRLSLNVAPEEIYEAADGEGSEVGVGGEAHGRNDGAVGLLATGILGAGQPGRPPGSNKGAVAQAGRGNRKRG